MDEHPNRLARLNSVLRSAQQSAFYGKRLAGIPLPLTSLNDLSSIPLLQKREMLGSSPGSPAKIFDRDRTEYTRLHQTSGTSGWPMPVLDTPNDWQWWLTCWQHVLDAAEVHASDVAMMAFSFGPFIGFWTATDALIQRGALVIPGGGMSSETRLQMILQHRCTVLCCTPTYALHLASVAKDRGIDLSNNPVKKIIVAGEPGGSIPAIRNAIESAWQARLTDHSGASELGAWGFGSVDGKGLHVIESEFIAECLVINEETPLGRPAQDGELSELVLTNLGRLSGPAIRYRTGDLVRAYRKHHYECPFLWLDGGVLGRADDMLVIRGVNIFPCSVEAIVREVDATAEFRMVATSKSSMDQLAIEAELDGTSARTLEALLRDRLALRVTVTTQPPGSLPRFEAKAKRLVDLREKDR